MAHNGRSSRRKFLTSSATVAGGALAAPYFFTAVRAQDAKAVDKLTIGCIGTGSRGMDILHQTKWGANIVAVCDVDTRHALQAKEAAGGKADVYEDYRKVLDRKDVQAVTVVTPDHWHTKIAIEAMQAGKDVYCEKPLTLTIDEGKLICKVAKETGRVFQVGTQQRTEFDKQFLTAVAIVRSGRLGKVRKVQCAIGAPPSSPEIPKTDPPKELNWDLWLGQTPVVDFRIMTPGDYSGYVQPYFANCHYEFRWWYAYSGGKLTDWGAHHVDIASWALGLDKSGPGSVKVLSSRHPVPFEKGMPTINDRYNTAVEFKVLAAFPKEEVEMTIRHDTDNGILFEGDKGRIFVNRERLSGRPVEELKDNPLPEDAIRQIYKGKNPTGHMANFFDCVKNREEPISDVWSHHRALTTCHLANIALRLDREVKWDADKEEIVGDDEARSFQSREQRKGFEIKA